MGKEAVVDREKFRQQVGAPSVFSETRCFGNKKIAAIGQRGFHQQQLTRR